MALAKREVVGARPRGGAGTCHVTKSCPVRYLFIVGARKTHGCATRAGEILFLYLVRVFAPPHNSMLQEYKWGTKLYFDTRPRKGKRAANAPPKWRNSDRTPGDPNFFLRRAARGSRSVVRRGSFTVGIRRGCSERGSIRTGSTRLPAPQSSSRTCEPSAAASTMLRQQTRSPTPTWEPRSTAPAIWPCCSRMEARTGRLPTTVRQQRAARGRGVDRLWDAVAQGWDRPSGRRASRDYI